MNAHRPYARLCLQPLEGRLAPANLTVTFASATHTLTVVGDVNKNDVTIFGDAADKTHFTLTSTGTINNNAASYSSPTGVQNIVIKMLDGDDKATFDNTVPIEILGNVAIDGGNGANQVLAKDLTVDKNLSITNGANAVGVDVATLDNLSVGGNVIIKNGDGATSTTIDRTNAGLSIIAGSLTITNGTGRDDFTLVDTNVDGSVKISNGHGGAGVAGLVNIYNLYNQAYRSIIGGNLTVTFLDGDVASYDGLWDMDVKGNLTLNNGPGTFVTDVDGFNTALPTLVHGNMSITGAGKNTVNVSVPGLGQSAGLIVGKSLSVTLGAADDTLNLYRLQVGGFTKLQSGDGNNTINLDDSIFVGKFNLGMGKGDDNFNLEAMPGTTTSTHFGGAVQIDFGPGPGNNTLKLADGVDAFQIIVVDKSFVVNRHQSSISGAYYFIRTLFPFGGHVLFVN